VRSNAAATFMGKPCRACGRTERYVAGNKECVVCQRKRRAVWQAKWRAANLDTARERNRLFMLKWIQENPELARERSRAGYRKHYIRRIPDLRANTVKYRARKRSALCDCCSTSEFRVLYRKAKQWGFQVDHVIPLACGGRHCVRNMQLLHPNEHKDKSAQEAWLYSRSKGAL
jgi:hypothetical protein